MAKLAQNGFYGWAAMPTHRIATKIEAASKAVGIFKKIANIDSIAFCGSSGSAAAFHLAMQHDLGLIYVRKDGEKTHGWPIEINQPVGRYIIVDDFISQGTTVRWIKEQIDNRVAEHRLLNSEATACELHGIVLYDEFTSMRYQHISGIGPIVVVGNMGINTAVLREAYKKWTVEIKQKQS